MTDRICDKQYTRLTVYTISSVHDKQYTRKQLPHESGSMGAKDDYFVFFWRRRVRIELTQDAPAPNTGFEDQETHQLPIRPQKTALT